MNRHGSCFGSNFCFHPLFELWIWSGFAKCIHRGCALFGSTQIPCFLPRIPCLGPASPVLG